jgi:hypothetical protein
VTTGGAGKHQVSISTDRIPHNVNFDTLITKIEEEDLKIPFSIDNFIDGVLRIISVIKQNNITNDFTDTDYYDEWKDNSKDALSVRLYDFLHTNSTSQPSSDSYAFGIFKPTGGKTRHRKGKRNNKRTKKSRLKNRRTRK